MYHSGMDAIDYELDASLVDDLDDYDYERGSGDSEGDLGAWGDYSAGSDGYSEDSDEESQKFPTNNLRNPKTFPSYSQCAPFELYDRRDWNDRPIPPPRHWCYLGEIVEHMTVPIRNILTVKDKDGESTHLSTNFDLEAKFDVKVGSTIAILYAERKYFSLGVYGLRLDHAKFVKIFPCDLETLLRINDEIESETPVGSPKKCKECGKEEETDKSTLRRCSRCLGASYCGTECQTASWKGGHKRECKIFQAVIELKSSRDWGNKEPWDWVAFGQREGPRPATPDGEDDDDSNDDHHTYYFQPEWKDVKPAVVQELRGTFTVTSGELLWGQMTPILSGLALNDGHDFPSDSEENRPYIHRAPARMGAWKIIKVNGYGHLKAPKDSWLAYHSSCDPLEMLLSSRPVCSTARLANPHVCWVNRYDWGSDCGDPSAAAQLFADIDPESGWNEALERQSDRYDVGIWDRKDDPDAGRWDRLDAYDSRNIFLVDVAGGPNLSKLLSRPSALDRHLKADVSSSFFKSEEDAESFGCNLAFIGDGDWEFARLIFGEDESTRFPRKKELIGFWYDADNQYINSERDRGFKLENPIIEYV